MWHSLVKMFGETWKSYLKSDIQVDENEKEEEEGDIDCYLGHRVFYHNKSTEQYESQAYLHLTLMYDLKEHWHH